MSRNDIFLITLLSLTAAYDADAITITSTLDDIEVTTAFGSYNNLSDLVDICKFGGEIQILPMNFLALSMILCLISGSGLNCSGIRTYCWEID